MRVRAGPLADAFAEVAVAHTSKSTSLRFSGKFQVTRGMRHRCTNLVNGTFRSLPSIVGGVEGENLWMASLKP